MPITTYTASFGRSELIHLLKRTMFGAKKSDIDFFNGQSLSQVVTYLINPAINLADIIKPLKEYATTGATTPDDTVANGTTWVNDFSSDPTIQSRRRASYKKWYTGLLINQDRSILEKMTLFWLNHFGTEAATIVKGNYVYNHNSLLRSFALGNFKDMVKAVTLDAAMLKYLNGNLNTRTAPDENYARELQELFTVGKALGINGYNEDDVKAAARVLTGWRLNTTDYGVNFLLSRHDINNKIFSSFYNNAVITGINSTEGGNTEIDALLTMIFQQEEVAKHIVRKLYRWFVYYEITPEIEQNIIVPLANTFRDSNYEVKPVLTELFNSQHFFDVSISQGAIIKSPVDFFIGALREWNVPFSNIWDTDYKHWNVIHNQLVSCAQSLHDPDNVSGYPAYYQEPQYHEIWINATTYPIRKLFTDTLINTGYVQNGFRIKIDTLAYTSTLVNPFDPNSLINEVVEHFLRIPLSDTIKNQLKVQYLLSGQTSDYYWSDAWQNYINAPTNTTYKNIVETRLKSFYQQIMSLEEYQLS